MAMQSTKCILCWQNFIFCHPCWHQRTGDKTWFLWTIQSKLPICSLVIVALCLPFTKMRRIKYKFMLLRTPKVRFIKTKDGFEIDWPCVTRTTFEGIQCRGSSSSLSARFKDESNGKKRKYCEHSSNFKPTNFIQKICTRQNLFKNFAGTAMPETKEFLAR